MEQKESEKIFKELRIATIFFGLIAVAIAIVLYIFGTTNKDWAVVGQYGVISLFILGLLQLFQGMQKFFQEHPKVRNVLVLILSLLAILGIVFSFYRIF